MVYLYIIYLQDSVPSSVQGTLVNDQKCQKLKAVA